MRTICVTGTGEAIAKPDLIAVSMDVNAVQKNYDQAMQLSMHAVDAIKKAVVSVGLDKEALKTTAFRVNSEYESVADANGNYKDKFVGYRVGHSLILRFPIDMQKLGALMNAISASGTGPEIRISFTVSDEEAVREAVLSDCTAKARKRAELLCQANGVSLGKLQTINYSWKNFSPVSTTSFLMEKRMALGSGLYDFVPDDIRFNESVDFVWEIL